MKWCAFALIAVLASVGSYTAIQSAKPAHADWVTANGGLVGDAPLARLQHAAAPLIAECHDPRLALHVLGSTQAGAYSWPDGQIYLTRGLEDRLTDAELAAAVAHELGHLTNDGCLTAPAALVGRSSCDAEARADETGIRLLTHCGLPTAAMSDLLGVMRSLHEIPWLTKAALQGRQARLAWLLAKN